LKDGIFLYLCSRNKNLLVKIEFFIVLDLIARKRPQGSRWRTLFLCLTTLGFFPPTLSAGVRFQAAKVAASRKLCKHRSPYSFTKKTAAFPFSFPFCPSPMGKGEKKKGIPYYFACHCLPRLSTKHLLWRHESESLAEKPKG